MLSNWALRIIAAGLVIAPLSFNQALADDKQDFEETDLNGNGHIDRGEYHSRMMDRFYLLDENRDGKLVLGELDFIDESAFKKADEDRDRSLTSTEYANSRYLDFVKADSNANGVLEPDEVDSWLVE
jgi:hypothetical protein